MNDDRYDSAAVALAATVVALITLALGGAVLLIVNGLLALLG